MKKFLIVSIFICSGLLYCNDSTKVDTPSFNFTSAELISYRESLSKQLEQARFDIIKMQGILEFLNFIEAKKKKETESK